MNLTDLPDDPPRLLALPELPLVRRVLYLGVFVMLAMVTQYMVNAADTLMVARLPDTAQATAGQAALGLGMPLYWAIAGFFSAISYGTQALTARRYGEGNALGAGKILLNSIMLAIVAGGIGAALGYFATPPAVDFLAQASEEQRVLAVEYGQVRMLGVGGTVVTYSYKAFFDGVGRTYVHLVAALVMNVFNVILNYPLIFGMESLGIESMGLYGAGLASTISTYLGLAIMLFASVRTNYRKSYRYYSLAHFDPGIIWRIFKLMVPAGLASVALMSGFLLFMRFVGDIDAAAGTNANTYSAATTALFNTAALCFMPLLAFGQATATGVSQSLGAGKPHLAARYGWESVRICMMAMFVLGAIFLLIPEQVIAISVPNDPAVIEAAVTPLRMVAFSLPFLVLALVLSQALLGAGANIFVLVMQGGLHIGLLVPLSWFLGPYLGYGMNGAWAAAVLYVVLLGIGMSWKFTSRGWRHIQL